MSMGVVSENSQIMELQSAVTSATGAAAAALYRILRAAGLWAHALATELGGLFLVPAAGLGFAEVILAKRKKDIEDEDELDDEEEEEDEDDGLEDEDEDDEFEEDEDDFEEEFEDDELDDDDDDIFYDDDEDE